MIALFGCKEEPALLPGEQPALYGGVEFLLGDYSIQYLELTDESGQTYAYPDPVLVVPLSMTNRGEDVLEYRPVHGSLQMSESNTPLLYPAPIPGEDGIDWAAFTKHPITGVNLERGSLPGQIKETTAVPPGESLQDLFLFELPDPGERSLVFSVPPSMHRGELPLLLAVDYREPTPSGPAVYSVGDTIDFDGVSFAVTAVSQEFIKLKDTAQGEGYSTEPVLKVAFTLTNSSDSTVSYNPAHRDVSGRQGALLHSLHTDFNRARFPATAAPEGQQNRVQLEAGESLEDYAIFERPDENVESATFELSAAHFERSGRVRVAFSYERAEIEPPEEMKTDD